MLCPETVVKSSTKKEVKPRMKPTPVIPAFKRLKQEITI